MTMQFTAKNLDAGDAIQKYIEEKISIVLDKYIGKEVDGHVRLEKERHSFRTNCSIRMPSGLLLEAKGEAGDAYGSADAAIERLEKRIRRHKRRLKNHHSGRSDGHPIDLAARNYTVQVGQDDDHSQPADNPVIIAETELKIREIPVSEAVMQLDLTEFPFLIFRNAAHGALNVVYRRQDGHIGWIDPNETAG